MIQALSMSAPSPQAYEEAKRHKLQEAEEVQVDLFAMKHCLAEGFPFAFGITLYRSFDQAGRDGRVPMPGPRDSQRTSHGSHAMLCVGYSEKSRAFVVRNSWGESWGDRGYGYIPYDYMTNPDHVGDCWTLRAVSDLDFAQQAWIQEDKGFFDSLLDAFLGEDDFAQPEDRPEDGEYRFEEDSIGALFNLFLGDEDEYNEYDQYENGYGGEREEHDPTQAEPLLDALALSIVADGHASDEEVDEAFMIAADLPGLSALSDARLEEALMAAFERIERDGDVVRSAERIAQQLKSPDARREAFTLSAAIQYVDGEVTAEEDEMLQHLGRALGLSENEQRAMIERIEAQG